MKIYSISELELLSKEQINEIIIERSKLCASMVSQALFGKKIESNMGKSLRDNPPKVDFTIKNITYHQNKDVCYDSNNTVIPINVYLDGYSCKTKKDTMHYDELAQHKLRYLLEKNIDENISIHWGSKKLQGLDYINMDLLFPTNLINPDIIAYSDYLNYCKQNKKASESSKERNKKKLQDDLEIKVNDLNSQRFNLLKEDYLYVPENKEELMEYISKATRKTFDKQALIGVVKKYPDNEEIIFEALYGFQEDVFEYASDRLKNDEKFIHYCLDNNRVNFLEFVGDKFKDDEQVIRKAINISGYIIRVASDRLKNDKQLCLIAIENQADAFGVISEEMRKDKDIINKILEKRGDYFCICPEVKTNKELLIKAFSTAFDRQSYNLLTRTSEEFRNDKEVAIAALRCSEDNIRYIGEKLKAEIGDYDPITYLTKIDLYNQMSDEVVEQDITPKKKLKM